MISRAAALSLLTTASLVTTPPLVAQDLAPAEPAAYVDYLYDRFLVRPADGEGGQFWTQSLTDGAVTRDGAAVDFLNTAELEVGILPLVRLYYASFGFIPDEATLEGLVAQRDGGASLEDLAAGFIATQMEEGEDFFGPFFTAETASDEQYVNALYSNTLGRQPTLEGLEYWTGLLAAGTSRAALLVQFSESMEYRAVVDDILKSQLAYQAFTGTAASAAEIVALRPLGLESVTANALAPDPAQALTEVVELAPGDPVCGDGGVQILQGLDQNQTDALDAGDLQVEQFFCRTVNAAPGSSVYRFATYNASLNRSAAGELIDDLSTPDNAQAQQVAEVIQRLRPDVLALLEFDFDAEGQALALFQANYLEVAQGDAEAIDYPFAMAIASNTGVPTGLDVDEDGQIEGDPNDAQGFGFHEGQFAFVVLSRFPIQDDQVRTFQELLWIDMPGNLLPEDYYDAEEQAVQRLSSKNHVDLPIEFPEGVVHALVAHPTPPVFDDATDFNGRRNHDEIRLFADYITPGAGDYLVDDQGQGGGLDSAASFVILGDYNADPSDGDSRTQAINQLLNSPEVAASVATGPQIPFSAGAFEQGLITQAAANLGQRGLTGYDTSNFNLRVDYVLPSADLTVIQSGQFWPLGDDPLAPLGEVSDHQLIFVDIALP